MLKTIEISNFVLVNYSRIKFGPGLNIITGETGAGKSILINAISQLCGERSRTDLIRSSEKKAVIEAVITNNWTLIKEIVDEHQLNINKDETIIILRKEIYSSGNSRIFINDSPVTLNVLSQLSEPLFDLHGQHQHQRLLHPEQHIYYMDDFANIAAKVKDFSTFLKQYNQAVKKRDDLKNRQVDAFQKQDMYRFQIKELTDSNLQRDEYESLMEEKKKMDNVEILSQLCASLDNILYSEEGNAGDLLTQAEGSLKQLTSFDDQFTSYLDSIKTSREAVEEVGRYIGQYKNELAFEPERMEYLNDRISRLEFLIKKYQKESIIGLIEYLTYLETQVKHVEEFDELIERAEKEIETLQKKVIFCGEELTGLRQTAGLKFEKTITKVLNEIGLPHARFKVEQTLKETEQSAFLIDGKFCLPNNRGFDVVRFSIQSNPGEPARPIHKVASGGEISRIMLAIKSALAEIDKTPVMVFDEIDAGISGKIAGTVGQKLSRLSQSHQIICVTHLPQIASFALQHFQVKKKIENSKTYIEVAPIENEERVAEIATLLAGEAVTPEAIDNARQLINESIQSK